MQHIQAAALKDPTPADLTLRKRIETDSNGQTLNHLQRNSSVDVLLVTA